MSIQNPFLNSVFRIDFDTAKELYDNYQNRLAPIIEQKQKNDVQRENYDTSKYAWISLTDLKNYIQLLEDVQAANKQEITGIAINMGAYNLDKDISSDDPNQRVVRVGDYRGRETLFIAPTFLSGEDATKIENHRQLQILPAHSSEPLVGTYTILDYDSSSADGTTMIMNNVSQFPPPLF